jgi:hypothetical protein
LVASSTIVNFFTDTGNPMDGGVTFDGGITGFPMADALLGYPSEVRRGQGNTTTDSIGKYLLGYVSDDWRVSNKLTDQPGTDVPDRDSSLRQDQSTWQPLGSQGFIRQGRRRSDVGDHQSGGRSGHRQEG